MFLTAAKDAVEAAKGATEAHYILAKLELAHVWEQMYGKQAWSQHPQISAPGGHFFTLHEVESLFWTQKQDLVSCLAAEAHKAIKKEAVLRAWELEQV